MLHVALVSEYYYPDAGGIPEHLHHLAAHLCRRGHRVCIVTTAYPPGTLPEPRPASPPPPPGAEVVRLGRSSAPILTNGSVSRAAVGLGLGRALRALFARRRFDVIHVHGPLFPVLPLLALAHAPAAAARCATLHTHFSPPLAMRALRRPLQAYLDALDSLIAVSPSAAASLHRMGLRFSAEIIENGVDLDFWPPSAPLAPSPDGALRLLVQARLEPRNRVDVLLAAMARLPPPRPRLCVIGDGPLRSALEAQARALGLCAEFAGARLADRPAFAARSDAYCFTAEIASHPVSLLEGMAAGLPAISHDIPGARELCRDGQEGLLVPPGDEAAWAAALSRLADPALRRRLGQAARRRAAAFSWEVIAERVEAHYQRALSIRTS